MPGWDAFVGLLASVLFGLAGQFGGNMGVAIAVLSLGVRLALLPLTLRLARRAAATRAAMARLEPERARIRARYGKDRSRELEETARLYRKHGVNVPDPRSVLGTLVQAPIFLGLFGAVRRGVNTGKSFLWVSNLGRPDLLLAVGCGLLAGASALVGPAAPSSPRLAATLLPTLLTVVFLSRVAAGIAIYVLASNAVGVLQSALLRRSAGPLAAR